MIFFLFLGIIQGIVEWLPVSSQGVITLITQAFPSDISLNNLTRTILLLHLGTFFAALIYFRHDVGRLCRSCLHYSKASDKTKKLFQFLFLTTMISGILGFGLQQLLSHYLMLAYKYQHTGDVLTAIVGILLIFTAFLQYKAKTIGKRTTGELNWKDSIILGVTQGLAALPGVSRSGSTVSLLLLRGFDKKVALQISFLMSLPIVLAGNIILNLNNLALLQDAWLGLIMSFVFGLFTIHFLLKCAERINFSLFVFCFGILTIASIFI